MATLQCRIRRSKAIMQMSSTQALVCTLDGTAMPRMLSVPSPIEGVDLWMTRALVWTATKAHIFELEIDSNGNDEVLATENSSSSSSATFEISVGSCLAIHKEFIFQTDDNALKMISMEGSLKRLLLLDDHQGKALCVDTCEEFVTLLTSTGYIRVWRIDERDITAQGPGSKCKVIADSQNSAIPSFIRCNCDGSRLSFLLKGSSEVESQLFVYDVMLGKVFEHNFRTIGRMPRAHTWDVQDPKLLACETSLVVEDSVEGQMEVTIMFATSEHGLLPQDKVKTDSRQLRLLGTTVPSVYFCRRSKIEDANIENVLEKRTMELFVGMDECDILLQATLLQFSLNIVLGNMNEAYKAVECIQDIKTWESLARYCVKSRLLDPTLYCFAKMGNGGEIISEASKQTLTKLEEGANLAALAIQLELFEFAQDLYIECERYDLLNLFYQASGNWDKAINIATKQDCIHLKNSRHAYAKHLESLGSIKEAIKQYELSDTHRFEVPRMLFSLQLMDELEAYVNKSKDKALQQWWAHFCEANDNLQTAIDYYKAAGDIASAVRVYCYLDDFKSAADVAKNFSDRSATFQLARQHEKNGNVHEAMHFFTLAGKSGYAAQLAMKHGIDSELLSLSLQSSKEIMVMSGNYFEEKGMHEEAVLLYQKGGNLEKAIDICARSQLFDALNAIADRLDEGTDKALLSRCGDFLLSHNQVEKAALLYVAAKQHDRALDLCIREGIRISEKLADEFSSRAVVEKESENYNEMMMQLAECCEAQGSYHLACKKYTQAGDRVKAIKALIKSDDTERIILFANASRQKQLYVLCGNYLQSLDWHQDPTLMRTIVQMYTRAAEMDLVAEFYETCAQIEIDEFRDYEKALGAMKEALKYAIRSKNSQSNATTHSLQQRISKIERFVQIRRMAKTDPEKMIEGCRELIDGGGGGGGDEGGGGGGGGGGDDVSECGVRIGDVYALLIEFYCSQNRMEEAYNTLVKTKINNIPMHTYIPHHLLHSIYQHAEEEIM